MGSLARGDGRYRYWFPLALLGFGLLALIGWESVRTAGNVSAATPGSQFYQDLTGISGYNGAVPLVIGASPWGWTVLITVSLVGTVAWYAQRPVWPSVAVALGGSAAIWLCYVIAGTEGLGDVGLPVLALGVLAGAYFALGRRRRVVAVISVVCLGVGCAVVLGSWLPRSLEPVLIGGGLFALAWFERSRLVAVVGCLVLAALLVFPDGMSRVLVPAVVVLAAAVVALVRRAPA